MSNGRLVHVMTFKVKALGGCSSHHMQGAWHTVAATLQASQLVTFCYFSLFFCDSMQ